MWHGTGMWHGRMWREFVWVSGRVSRTPSVGERRERGAARLRLGTVGPLPDARGGTGGWRSGGNQRLMLGEERGGGSRAVFGRNGKARGGPCFPYPSRAHCPQPTNNGFRVRIPRHCLAEYEGYRRHNPTFPNCPARRRSGVIRTAPRGPPSRRSPARGAGARTAWLGPPRRSLVAKQCRGHSVGGIPRPGEV